MIRLKHIAGLALLLALGSCEKDAPLPDPIYPTNLAQYRAAIPMAFISDDLWVHAGNHPSFEKETDERPLHIRFYYPENAQDVTLFLNDSIQFSDSLALYRKTKNTAIREKTEHFGRFAISAKDYARWAVLSYVLEDTFVISAPIILRAQNTGLDTKEINALEIQTTAAGRAYIDWTGSAAATNRNLVILTDVTGESFCAVECTDPSFLFHNLRNVARDFTPSLNDPRLVEGETYGIQIFMTDGSGWMRNIGQASFIADSTLLQTFD